MNKHYGVKRLLKEFLNNDWRKGGLRHLIRKIYKTKDFARILGSGRTPTALTNENVEEVKEFILSFILSLNPLAQLLFARLKFKI